MATSEQDEAAEAAEAARIAAAVEAGTDGIEVPPELVEERADEPEVGAAPARGRDGPGTLYAQILTMPLMAKVKLALRGNKEARALLVRDGSRTVRRYVLENPRISEEEVVQIARDRQADEEMLRAILRRREWLKLYQVRLGLVKNPRTPLPNAIRLLGTLLARDVERIAKSRDVPQAVVAQARRVVLESRHRS